MEIRPVILLALEFFVEAEKTDKKKDKFIVVKYIYRSWCTTGMVGLE